MTLYRLLLQSLARRLKKTARAGPDPRGLTQSGLLRNLDQALASCLRHLDRQLGLVLLFLVRAERLADLERLLSSNTTASEKDTSLAQNWTRESLRHQQAHLRSRAASYRTRLERHFFCLTAYRGAMSPENLDPIMSLGFDHTSPLGMAQFILNHAAGDSALLLTLAGPLPGAGRIFLELNDWHWKSGPLHEAFQRQALAGETGMERQP